MASNDADRLRGSFPATLVIKSLDTVLLRDGDDCLFTYTTINPTSRLCDETVRSVPFLAQQALSNKTDVRVTIIGDRSFAVRILSRGRGIPGDWRKVPKVDLEYEDFPLDDSVAESCHRLAEILGLNFAAIDRLETPSGVYFIEINPTGEWGWLSSKERPLHKAIASWLAEPTNSKNDQWQ